MALRVPLEVHFEHFWGLLAKWLPGGLQGSLSACLSPVGQMAFIWRLVLSMLEPVGIMALSQHLETHFQHLSMLESVGQMARVSRSVEAHFEHVWALPPT